MPEGETLYLVPFRATPLRVVAEGWLPDSDLAFRQLELCKACLALYQTDTGSFWRGWSAFAERAGLAEQIHCADKFEPLTHAQAGHLLRCEECMKAYERDRQQGLEARIGSLLH